MEKIKEITQVQFETIRNAEDEEQLELFKELVGVDEDIEFEIGDSTILVNNSKALEIYKDKYGDQYTYYLIIEPRDEMSAYAWTLYPKF